MDGWMDDHSMPNHILFIRELWLGMISMKCQDQSTDYHPMSVCTTCLLYKRPFFPICLCIFSMFKPRSIARNRPQPVPIAPAPEPVPSKSMDISNITTSQSTATTPLLSNGTTSTGTSTDPYTGPRRWKGLVLPAHEYSVIKASDPVTKKCYYHLMVNVFQKERIMTIATELLTEFDKEKTGRSLKPIPVSPGMYGLQTNENAEWYLFMYVPPKSLEELKSCKDNELYVRCIYWENVDSLYKNGVSLTGMRTAVDLGQTEMTGTNAVPLEGWNIEIL
jgi:hypothetical protein